MVEEPEQQPTARRGSSVIQEFLGELKRRRVPRVVLVYGVATFAVLQAADIVLPALGLSDFAMRLLVITTLVGLPIAVAVSWLFDITSEGIVRTAESHGESPGPIRLLSVGSALVFVGVLAAGGLGWFFTEATTVAPGPVSAGGAIRSIVVLPFENAGDNPEDAYFSDGLSDELRSRLSHVPELDVAARASSLAAIAGEVDPAAAASALGVRSVLTGSVAKSDARVRVQTQLLSADGNEIWSAEYERLIDDLFVVQDEVSRAILSALELRFAEGELPLDDMPTTNQMAYDKYLWGQFNANRHTEAGFIAAIDNYQMSIGFDSLYAPAWAGEAEAHARASEILPDDRVRDALEAGRGAALEALKIDPASSEARSALGLFLSRQYDWTGADAEFQRAVAGMPSSSSTLVRRALAFTGAGRHEQAVAAIRAAERVDAMSSAVKFAAARVFTASGRIEQAIRKAQEGIAMNSTDERIWTEIAFLFLAESRFGDAADAFARVAEVKGIDLETMAAFVAGAERHATTGQAQEIPGDLSAALGDRSVDFARYQLAVGQYGPAIATLQTAVDRRAFGVATLVWLPDVDPIRADTSFKAILVELGIEPQQLSN
jgi:TolB-like protein